MSKGCIWLLLIIGSWVPVIAVVWLVAKAITFCRTLLLSML